MSALNPVSKDTRTAAAAASTPGGGEINAPKKWILFTPGATALIALAAGAVSALFLQLMLIAPQDKTIEALRNRLYATEATLLQYERADTRAELKAARGAVDFQAWAQEQPEYYERVQGTECIVNRVTKDKWRVVKRHVGSNAGVLLESAVGGPLACDRLPV